MQLFTSAAEKAGRWLGVTEMMLGNSVCGLIFALFSGQPLLIVGATGPLLVFEEALYQVRYKSPHLLVCSVCELSI